MCVGLITCITIYGSGNTEQKYEGNHVCSPITAENENRSHGIIEYFAVGFLIFLSFFTSEDDRNTSWKFDMIEEKIVFSLVLFLLACFWIQKV